MSPENLGNQTICDFGLDCGILTKILYGIISVFALFLCAALIYMFRINILNLYHKFTGKNVQNQKTKEMTKDNVYRLKILSPGFQPLMFQVKNLPRSIDFWTSSLPFVLIADLKTQIFLEFKTTKEILKLTQNMRARPKNIFWPITTLDELMDDYNNKDMSPGKYLHQITTSENELVEIFEVQDKERNSIFFVRPQIYERLCKLDQWAEKVIQELDNQQWNPSQMI
uniref:Uncharacterized protein n=1 Tax=Panagrolaimus sp. JU765 TaxID=591449 RepID=A0AC34QXM7_9BILA